MIGVHARASLAVAVLWAAATGYQIRAFDAAPAAVLHQDSADAVSREVYDKGIKCHGPAKAGGLDLRSDEGLKKAWPRLVDRLLASPHLHLLGLDFEKLTYRFNGRDMRLTDVHGKVIKEILA